MSSCVAPPARPAPLAEAAAPDRFRIGRHATMGPGLEDAALQEGVL